MEQVILPKKQIVVGSNRRLRLATHVSAAARRFRH